MPFFRCGDQNSMPPFKCSLARTLCNGAAMATPIPVLIISGIDSPLCTAAVHGVNISGSFLLQPKTFFLPRFRPAQCVYSTHHFTLPHIKPHWPHCCSSQSPFVSDTLNKMTSSANLANSLLMFGSRSFMNKQHQYRSGGGVKYGVLLIIMADLYSLLPSAASFPDQFPIHST